MKNFTQTIRKIFALGTGATLMGTTLLGAGAVSDLGNYPSPFVQDGSLNSIIVIGDNADAADVIGATDIIAGLQFESKTPVGVSSGVSVGSSVTGDAWKVGTSNNDLELTETVSSVVNSIGDDAGELQILADGEFRVRGSKTYEYEQRIEFGSNLVVRFTEDDDENIGNFLTVSDDDIIATYVLRI